MKNRSGKPERFFYYHAIENACHFEETQGTIATDASSSRPLQWVNILNFMCFFDYCTATASAVFLGKQELKQLFR
ncbi:MAG: hypothetical protein K9H49_16130 [Bacteroidales bacterium]|nr:hypothetical protein [Bacteroidales bacterium]